jgi:hypothetical protein
MSKQAGLGHESEPFAQLGKKPELHQRKEAWKIDVRASVPHVDPMAYFMTSGEAVIKAKKLEADLWKAAAAARKFANLLEKARGKHKYLELELVGGGIAIVKTKDPRPNPRLIKDNNSEIKDNGE